MLENCFSLLEIIREIRRAAGEKGPGKTVAQMLREAADEGRMLTLYSKPIPPKWADYKPLDVLYDTDEHTLYLVVDPGNLDGKDN